MAKQTVAALADTVAQKFDQIENRLEEIHTLRDQMGVIGAEYEAFRDEVRRGLAEIETALNAQQKQIHRVQTPPYSARSVNQPGSGKTHHLVHHPNARTCGNCGKTAVWGRMGCPSSECLRARVSGVA